MAEDVDDFASLPVSEVWAMRPEAYDVFLGVLENPPEPTPALVALMRLRHEVAADSQLTPSGVVGQTVNAVLRAACFRV